MTFGITSSGFEIKRLEDILSEKRALAIELFQDLLLPSDIVDTSDSSTLGRLINLSSPSQTELWEQGQLAYSSLDPNTATGIALDNIVAYTGIERLTPSPSLVTGLFLGDNGSEVPIESLVGSTTHSNEFFTTATIDFNSTACSGIVIEVDTVTDSVDYTIDYSVGVSTNTVTYDSGVSATEDSILTGIVAEIIANHPQLEAEVIGDTTVITKADIFASSNFSVDSKLTITKIYKLGNLQATENGELSAEANSLTVIKTPALGWDTVTNPLAASLGTDTETDEELRLRFRNTKFERSSNILDSMYSALINLDTVDSVTVYENDTDITDVNGLPPHSFMAVVLGGESEVIAETIWDNKPAGITSVGDTTIEIIDSQNFPRDINFQRPSPVNIYISIELGIDEEYPADGADQIKTAIIEYANQEFGVGKDVIYSRLYTPINSIPGHQVNELFIAITPSPAATSNISIDFDEIASFSSVNIDITTV
jgi:uncharacterized phage protein gp47/JayE